MSGLPPPRRFAALPSATGGARGAAGTGLLIPRCRSVRTAGMRFARDIAFFDGRSAPIEVGRAAPRRGGAWVRGGGMVLGLRAPSGYFGELVWSRGETR